MDLSEDSLRHDDDDDDDDDDNSNVKKQLRGPNGCQNVLSSKSNLTQYWV